MFGTLYSAMKSRGVTILIEIETWIGRIVTPLMKSQWKRRHICWNELMEPKGMKHTWGKRQCQALKITIWQIIQTCIQQWFPLDFHLFSSYLVFKLTSVCAVVSTGCKPAGRRVLPMPMLFFPWCSIFIFPHRPKAFRLGWLATLNCPYVWMSAVMGCLSMCQSWWPWQPVQGLPHFSVS